MSDDEAPHDHDAEHDHSVTTIDGWVPLGTHLLLQRAAEIAARRRHPYLGTEHIAAAITESRLVTTTDGVEMNIGSHLTRVWPDGGRKAITLGELHELIEAGLPNTGALPVLAARFESAPTTTVDTEYQGPHAAEIHAQLERDRNGSR